MTIILTEYRGHALAHHSGVALRLVPDVAGRVMVEARGATALLGLPFDVWHDLPSSLTGVGYTRAAEDGMDRLLTAEGFKALVDVASATGSCINAIEIGAWADVGIFQRMGPGFSWPRDEQGAAELAALWSRPA